MNLRKCTIDDAQIIHEELGCNPEMMRYTGWNPYRTLESTIEFLQMAINAPDEYSWIIEKDGQAAGMFGAYDYNGDDASIEIGCSIFRGFWGQGLASASVAEACENLKASGIKLVKAWAALDNIGSVKALEKNGFTRTETIESGVNVDGDKYDQVFFEKKVI